MWWQEPITKLKGIGPKKAADFANLNIFTIGDLLNRYPRTYVDQSKVKTIAELATDGEKQLFCAEVYRVADRISARRMRYTLVTLKDATGFAELYMFAHQRFQTRNFKPGTQLLVDGKVQPGRGAKMVTDAYVQILKDGESASAPGILPVYALSGALTQQNVRTAVKTALAMAEDYLPESLPQELINAKKLPPRFEAVKNIHFPASFAELARARSRFIFEELFLLQCGLLYYRSRVKSTRSGIKMAPDGTLLQKVLAQLPFKLTEAQQKAWQDISLDMQDKKPMHRLLQGDVGSGKTVVSALALAKAAENGYQACIMVPTEILAQQHAKKLSDLFQDFGVSVCLLTGTEASKTKVKHDILERLANKEIDILVGTHALIQDPVIFKKLGLVVTDEQHRFGVNQRKALREKGENPDVLAMTATPIPRTLAITTYGEMDVSVINELPKGRKPIRTSWVKQNQMNATLDFLERQLKDGSQAYVVSPLIEESEAVDLKNAQEVFEKLEKRYAPYYKVGLLHGRMKSDEKDEIMKDFKEGKYDILVSTTVVEVGVDVPNATVMVILDADRFGLAQLHQLRGRVGRGSKASYCILCADPKTDYGKERMQTMVETTDGFVISQKDLELRGPGEVLGSRQSGLPDFRIGDPVANFNTLQAAMEEARAIILDENFEYRAENAGLIRYLRAAVLAGANFD